MFKPDGIAWQADGDTALTIFFGTIGIILAVLQVLFSWRSARALQARN